MKFNFKTLSLLLAGAALGLTACSNDDLLNGERQDAEGSGKYFHVQAGIALPTLGGTRSATDEEESDGEHSNSNEDVDIEQGYDYENEIRTMILVYTDNQYRYITHSVVKGITKAPLSGVAYDYEVIGEIAHENLEEAYESGVLKDYDGTQDIYVFAICNYTERLEGLFAEANKDTGSEWVDWTGTVDEEASPAGHTPIIQNTIWAPRSFLMTNYALANVKFPASIDLWDEYTDRSTPWHLNTTGNQGAAPDAIRVQHVAARIDFRDASGEVEGKKSKTPNTYDLLLDVNSYGDTGNPGPGEPEGDTEDDPSYNHDGHLNVVSIQLTRMALVNMSKEFYYLPRVSDNGLLTGANYALCGKEYQKWENNKPAGANFVVDTDAEAKNNGTINAANEATYFNFPLYTTEGVYNKKAWYVDDINTVLEGTKDGWNTTPYNGKYSIWRYVTENTIPGAKNQITGQSTGVVFKGKIIAGVDIENAASLNYVSQELKDALANVDKTQGSSIRLYSFENRLFAGPKDIIAGAWQDGENSALYGAVKKVLANWKSADGKKFEYNGTGEIALEPKLANAILQGFDGYTEADGYSLNITDDNFYKENTPQTTQIAVYEASDEEDGEGWGYYCYYFYWNRHNDNGKAGLMGDMEFATVRNNVYKLAVTKINRIGHPTIPGDDPDPEEFEDPDEPPTNYIQVQVDVLPWVVRVNDIEF